jgi:hypothetical protein
MFVALYTKCDNRYEGAMLGGGVVGRLLHLPQTPEIQDLFAGQCNQEALWESTMPARAGGMPHEPPIFLCHAPAS